MCSSEPLGNPCSGLKGTSSPHHSQSQLSRSLAPLQLRNAGGRSFPKGQLGDKNAPAVQFCPRAHTRGSCPKPGSTGELGSSPLPTLTPLEQALIQLPTSSLPLGHELLPGLLGGISFLLLALGTPGKLPLVTSPLTCPPQCLPFTIQNPNSDLVIFNPPLSALAAPARALQTHPSAERGWDGPVSSGERTSKECRSGFHPN